MNYSQSRYFIISLLILLFSASMLTFQYSENFQSYKLKPLGEVYTGTDPLYFYKYMRYKKPYRYPFKFTSSYPYGHDRHFS